MGFGPRTLFFGIRAVDQTGRAFSQLDKKLKTLEERQQAIASASYRLMFAGVALAVFGQMAMASLAGTLDTTVRGARALSDYEVAVNRIKKALAQGIMNNFGDAIENTINSIDKMSKDDEFWDTITAIGVPATLTLTVTGVTMAAVGLAGKIFGSLLSMFVKYGWVQEATAIAWAGGAGAAIGMILPVVITFAVAAIIWSLDVGGIRSYFESLWETIQEEATNQGLTITPGIGHGMPKRDGVPLSFEESREFYQGLNWGNNGSQTNIDQNLNITIERYVTELTDEEVQRLFGDSAINSLVNKDGYLVVYR